VAEVLTADLLGKCFDLSLAPAQHDGRWRVRTARSARP
jgi:iron complex transport system ATP-binding protein